MRFISVLASFASLCMLGNAALPPAGTYYISNAQTNLYVTDTHSMTPVGNPIIANELFNGTNQRWTISTLATGIYQFVAVGPPVSIGAVGQLGAGLTVQPLATPLSVAEVPSAPGQYWVTYPFLPLAMTTTTDMPNWLTLQTFSATDPLQMWEFTPV